MRLAQSKEVSKIDTPGQGISITIVSHSVRPQLTRYMMSSIYCVRGSGVGERVYYTNEVMSNNSPAP